MKLIDKISEFLDLLITMDRSDVNLDDAASDILNIIVNHKPEMGTLVYATSEMKNAEDAMKILLARESIIYDRKTKKFIEVNKDE